MEVNQVYTLVNNALTESLGSSTILNEDLSNVVEVGTEVFNANAMDSYVKSLVNHVGKFIFVERQYRGRVPSVLMDSWEYGSVLEKVQADIPQAQENETWDLTDGQSYDPNVFYKPSVSVKFYNGRTTFEVPLSFTERQVKDSFSSATQLNGFLSMLFNSVDKALTIALNNLIRRTINNMIAESIYDDYANTALSTKSGVKVINLLYLYNQAHGAALTSDDCLTDLDFLKFASYTIKNYKDRLTEISTLFNVGGKERFTPTELMHVVLLSDFANASDVYLQSDTYHNDLTALPNYEVVPYWQGSGQAYSFDDISKIEVKSSGGHSISAKGIIGVIFDHDSLGVSNLDRRVTTNYNAKAEFYNNFYKMDAGFFNDLNENFIVFVVA